MASGAFRLCRTTGNDEWGDETTNRAQCVCATRSGVVEWTFGKLIKWLNFRSKHKRTTGIKHDFYLNFIRQHNVDDDDALLIMVLEKRKKKNTVGVASLHHREIEINWHFQILLRFPNKLQFSYLHKPIWRPVDSSSHSRRRPHNNSSSNNCKQFQFPIFPLPPAIQSNQ